MIVLAAPTPETKRIEILSHREFVQRAFQNTPRNLIFISNPEYPFIVEHSEEAVGRVANSLVLLFDDVLAVERGSNVPEKRHALDAICFAQGLDELVVSCRMGVSRSAAIAFAVVAKRSGIAEAFRFLNPERHSPNDLIIGHIQELLDLPYLSEAMAAWKKEQQKEFDYYISEHHAALKRREDMRKQFA